MNTTNCIFPAGATYLPTSKSPSLSIRAILETKPMQEAIDRTGVEPVLYTQAEFAAYLKAEGDKWGPVIKAKNIQAD